MTAATNRAFAAPAELAPDVLERAEALWASTLQSADDVYVDATDRALAELLGLGDGDGHDELTRCDVDDCNAWFWADEGATVHYESGTVLTVCAAHAVADDPGARVYPGVDLAAALHDADLSAMCDRIRTTGSPW